MSAIKEQLYALCQDYISCREAEIKKIIEDVRSAANNDTKSSAGDKYETGREVMQQDINLNLTRLNELSKLKTTLNKIVPEQDKATIIPGSVAYTNNGNYYIAISAGVLQVDGIAYFAVSAVSPIGTSLTGKRAGSEFILNGKTYVIDHIV